jgi:cytochrome o ubiquinol oxidase subunit 3
MLQKVTTVGPVPGDEHEHDPGHTTVLGFWFYLMTDCILFASVFASYVVLSSSTAGGPASHQLFDLPYLAVETACLLVSSFTYGLASIAMRQNRKDVVLTWLAVTFLLGLAFIGMEINEFYGMVSDGAGPDRSAFLSGFFTLVGTHGVHVTIGLGWMALMMIQVLQNGLEGANHTRLMCLGMFWHFLDIIWIGVFTIVYLSGAM